MKLDLLKSSLPFLECPDCSGEFIIINNRLKCTKCNSEFRILSENIIDLVSKKSFNFKTNSLSTLYSEYSELRMIGHPTKDKARLWGLDSKYGSSGFVSTLQKKILSFLDDTIICDVGAGIGNYSLLFAKKSKMVFHCDLDLEAISFAAQEAQKQDIHNILFIRCDYLFLPFRNDSLSCITCIDVLEKGKEHDLQLIEQISKKLSFEGKFFIDFHSKERTKLTKAPQEDRYSKNDIFIFLKKYHLSITNIFGMGHLPTLGHVSGVLYSITNTLCKLILPPARWLVIGQKSDYEVT